MQSKKHSLFESIANVVIGYVVALISQIVIFPVFGIYIPLSSHIGIGLFFTVVSLVRSYVLRRVFTKHTEVSKP